MRNQIILHSLHSYFLQCEDLGLDFDGKINMWDFRRFLDLVIEQKFSLDLELLKEYFPLHVVMDGMLKIYQTLLGLTFTSLPNVEAWSDDVTAVRFTCFNISTNRIAWFCIHAFLIGGFPVRSRG